MPSIKLERFQGLIPRASDRLLPPMAATEAKNTKLLNGELRGFHAMREEVDFSSEGVSPVQSATRIRDPAGVNPDDWLIYDSRDIDVVRSPLINDGYDRYYIAGDGRPKYNTYARIYADQPALYLGVPTPTAAPTVTPPAGADLTRAYVYTFVSSMGEEGPPSPPTVATGIAGTWELSNINTTVPDAANRDITVVKIYRTVTGGTSSNFYYVGQIALGTSTFSDNVADTTVAANNLLESTSFIEPPTDLEGFVVMPNGYLVGWAGRRLMMSEPYRPHAWPAEYEMSTEYPIVGLVVWGSTLVIGTESQPYFGQGTHPAAFTTRKLDAVEPCLSRHGMVATTAGAYYPSINGLVLADASGARVITQDILTKEEWNAYNPASIFAAQLGLQYIAFNSDSGGFVFNPTEPETKLVELEGFQLVGGIETDKYSGDVLVLAQDRAWNWDPTTSERLPWRWQSKVYQSPEPMNFGAGRIQFLTGTDNVTVDIDGYYQPYNTALFSAIPSGTTTPPLEQTRGLNTLNGHPLGGGGKGVNQSTGAAVTTGAQAQGYGLVAGWTETETRQPLGGSLLYPIVFMSFQGLAVRFQAFIDGETTPVFDKMIYNESIFRMPTGFKSDLWQFNMQGNTDVYSVQIGTTPRAIKQV